MAESLFLLSGDGTLKTMAPAPFDTEDVFQALLERHPSLLTASNFGESEARRWVLVRREMSVGDSAESGGRWSLDHLFLDQDGIPTLVEIKRASDTRARREVVAQMLDYAANAVSWWRIADLVEHFAVTAAARGFTSQQALDELLQTEGSDEEAYWKAVQANLASGRIRMLFVADVIYPELQRIVEFLNEQMNPAVVAALELRPFGSGDDRLIAPRIIGETQKARALKSVSGDHPVLSPDDWLQDARANWSTDRAKAIDTLRTLLLEREYQFETSKGGYNAAAKFDGRNKWMMTIGANGAVNLNFGNWSRLGLLASPASRAGFIEKFAAIPGIQLSTTNTNGYPKFDPERVSAAGGWPEFAAVVDALSAAARSKE